MLTKSDLFKLAHKVTRETCYKYGKYGCSYRVTFGATLKELMHACEAKNALKVWRFLGRKDKPLGSNVKPIVNDLLKLFRTALNDPLFKKGCGQYSLNGYSVKTIRMLHGAEVNIGDYDNLCMCECLDLCHITITPAGLAKLHEYLMLTCSRNGFLDGSTYLHTYAYAMSI